MKKINEVKVEKNTFVGQGTLSLDLTKNVKSENDQTAVVELLTMINSYNIDLSEITLKTISGQVHTFRVEDLHMEWHSITEDDE
jgi:hypothetical protein